MKNPALAVKLAVALPRAACGPADAGNAPATVAAAGASGAQDLPMVTEVGFSDLLRDPATPFIGAENADIIIIGFMDYNCPYCKMMIPELEGLMKADPKVRILYKEWPIFGAVSENVARLAMAANYQGKYHEVHKAFMGAKGRIETDQQARSLARAAGVDMNQLDRDLATHREEIDAVILRNTREASALALSGTPAFIINGNLIPGGMPQAQLEAVIARIRAGQPVR